MSRIDITEHQDDRPHYLDTETGEVTFVEPFPVDELLKLYMAPAVEAIRKKVESDLLALYEAFARAER